MKKNLVSLVLTVALVAMVAPMAHAQALVVRSPQDTYYSPSNPIIFGTGGCFAPITFTAGWLHNDFQVVATINGFQLNWRITSQLFDGTVVGSQEKFKGSNSFKYNHEFNGKTGDYNLVQDTFLQIHGDQGNLFTLRQQILVQYNADTGVASTKVLKNELVCNQ
jgi:hypothetical protein